MKRLLYYTPDVLTFAVIVAILGILAWIGGWFIASTLGLANI